MLAIPLMKSLPVGQFDLTPLTTYLKNQRCYDDALLDSDLMRFQSMRVQVSSISDPSDGSHQLMLQYVNQLMTMVPRIPAGVLEHEIKQPFHWNDAFQTNKRNSFNSLHFEICAVIWNLGALESLRGGRLDRSTDEGIRMAAKSFQYAAGCFDYLLTTIVPLLPQVITQSCSCFSNECLNMAKLLMLAQAQLCFYEKAVRDKKKDLMKSAIIAKLAAQVAVLYSQACASTKSGGIVQILDISWFAITDFQAKSFQAAKEYWQGQASKEIAASKGSGYGEEVARYIRAEQQIRQAMEVSRRFNLQASLQNGADSLLQAITTSRTQALHDLNTIYMEAVMPDHNLTDIPPVSMVKPTPFQLESDDGAGLGDNLMFKYILPREFIAAMRKFYDEVSSTYKKCEDSVVDATNMGRMTLSSIALPGSIEACKASSSTSSSAADSSDVPDSIWQRIREIQSQKGGIPLLRDLYDSIMKSHRRAAQTVSTIQDALTDAEQKDNSFRVRFPQYPGQKMEEMNQDIRSNVAKFQHALMNAQTNDEVLRVEINSDEMSRLSMTREELNSVFQQAVASASGAVSPSATGPALAPGTMDLLDLLDDTPVAPSPSSSSLASAGSVSGYIFHSPEMLQLEEKLHDLAGLFESRQRDLDSLKQLGTIDLSKELGLSVSNTNAGDQLYQKYAQEMHILDKNLQSSLQQQETLLNEIVKLNEIFVKQREADPVLKAKNQLIQGLEQAINKFSALQAQLTAGQTFYSNLQSQLTTLQQNADDNAYTAQWQRQEYEASCSTKAPPTHAATNTNHLANQFASSVHVTPSIGTSSYSAYPSFATTPSTGTHTTTHTAYTPTVTSYVAPPPAVAAPSHAALAASSGGYQYNQNAYSVLPQPAPAYHQQPQQQHQQQNMYAPPSTPQSHVNNNFPGAVVGQPTSAPAGYGTYPGAAPPSRPPRPLTTQEMDAKVSRLMEMGFPHDKVTQALSSTNWNEEAALNILLGVAPESVSQQPGMHSQQGSPAATSPHTPSQAPGSGGGHKSGLFKNLWGKK